MGQETAVESNRSDELTLADLVVFLRRRWALVIGVAAIFGGTTALVVGVVKPPVWAASATVAIVPPTFSSDLKPPTLTVQGYQQLLESAAVVAEARRQLIEQGVLEADDRLEVGDELSTRIFVSRRSEETSLAPLVQAVAEGPSAEKAAQIANTWVGVFLERTHDLMAGTTSSAVEFIEEQFPQASEALKTTEDVWLSTQVDFRERLAVIGAKWSRRLATYDGETAELVAAYQSQTQAELAREEAAANIAARELQLHSLQASLGQLQSDEAAVGADLERKRLELAATKEQLDKTPRLIALQKAMTDDAMWQREAAAQGADPNLAKVSSHVLVTQEPNPVHQQLLSRSVLLAADVSALEPRAAQLERRIAETSERIKAFAESLSAAKVAIEQLRLERDAGLVKLRAVRQSERELLVQSSDSEVKNVEAERDLRLSQLDREVSQQSQLRDELAKSFNQAVLAKSERDTEDIRLAAAAVAPDRPERRRTLLKSALAACVGGLLGLLVAMLREASGRLDSGRVDGDLHQATTSSQGAP